MKKSELRQLIKEEMGMLSEVDNIEIGKFYKQTLKSGDEIYFYPTELQKNGGYKGYKFDVFYGERLKGKPKQISVKKSSFNLWKPAGKIDDKIMQKYSSVLITESFFHTMDNILDAMTYDELITTVESNEKIIDDNSLTKVFNEILKYKINDAKETFRSNKKQILKTIRSN